MREGRNRECRSLDDYTCPGTVERICTRCHREHTGMNCEGQKGIFRVTFGLKILMETVHCGFLFCTSLEIPPLDRHGGGWLEARGYLP